MKLKLSTAAVCAVAGAHPSQLWAFVCSSTSATADVVAAYPAGAIDRAKMHAREIDGCTRLGRVAGDVAATECPSRFAHTM